MVFGSPIRELDNLLANATSADFTSRPFLHPFSVALGLSVYIVSITWFSPTEAPPADTDNKKTTPSSVTGKAAKTEARRLGISNFVFCAHNILLAVFSMYIFWLSLGPAREIYLASDTCHVMWHQNHQMYQGALGDLVYYFYLSKYYEYVDTWIVMYRGRKPQFLQTYHHIGAVVSMWLLYVAHNPFSITFVFANSFVHSVMYVYYAASCLLISFPFKNVITLLQLTQFVTGVSWGIYYSFACRSGLTRIVQTTLWFNVTYVVVLFFLFRDFYRKTYSKSHKQADKSDKNEAQVVQVESGDAVDKKVKKEQ